MSKKQSSIEWYLMEEVDLNFDLLEGKITEAEFAAKLLSLIAQASAMHKEEIEEAYGHGQNNGYMYAHQRAIMVSKENYFNQTFGGQDNE